MNKNLYLPEDADLIHKMNSADLGDLKKISEIQIEAILRNRKTSEKLNKSTDQYSIVLIGLTFFQISLALFETFLNVVNSERAWFNIIFFIIFLIIPLIVIYKLNRILKDKNE